MSYDGLHGCEKCGNDCIGRLCTSCQQQEYIDNDPCPPSPFELRYCEFCSNQVAGYPPQEDCRTLAGDEYTVMCPECYRDSNVNGGVRVRCVQFEHYVWD